VTAGAGVAALGAGVLFGLKARSIDDEARGWDVFDPDRFADGEAAERNMFIAYGVGGALVVTGGVLYYLGHKAGRRASDSAPQVTFAPSVTPTAVLLGASGDF